MGRYLINPLLDCFRLQCLLRLTVVSISPLLWLKNLNLEWKFSFVDHDGQTHAAIIFSSDEYHIDCGSVYLCSCNRDSEKCRSISIKTIYELWYIVYPHRKRTWGWKDQSRFGDEDACMYHITIYAGGRRSTRSGECHGSLHVSRRTLYVLVHTCAWHLKSRVLCIRTL